MPPRALPSFHVPRPRLVRALAAGPIGLVEAGGGYGKSVLAAELREHLGVAAAEATLERETAEAAAVVGALRRGFRRAGLSDIAAALVDAAPPAVLDALERAPEPLLLVVDELHRAGGEAVELLAALARELPQRHRLLLAGRRLDPRLTALRTELGAVHLNGESLAFEEQELTTLLTVVLGGPAAATQVEHVRRLALGWPAASVLAATRLARAPGQELPVPGRTTGALGGLIDELLAGTDEATLERMARLGHLPLLSEPVAEACAGPGALDLLIDAGLPLRAGRVGWLELPEPIRDELAARAPLPHAAGRRVAAAYAEGHELPAAVALLARLRDPEGIAELIATRSWQALGALDLAELRALIGTLPPQALAEHPRALVQVARLAERSVDIDVREELLSRALELLPDGAERREAEAELAANQAIVDPSEEVERSARSVLAAAEPGETAARARALTAIARVEAWRGDPASLLAAEQHLGEVAALCRLADEREWQAWTLTALGYRVAFARGDLERAVEHMTAALALVPEPGSERAAVATFLADVLAYVGRYEDSEAALREAADIGRKLGDHRVQAYAAWGWAILASLQGDAAATIQRIRTVERHPGDWFDHPTGAEFQADATLALARVGERELAIEYERKVRENAERLGYPEIAWIATGAVEARFGDPDKAEAALTAYAASPQQPPRDEWHTLLLRAAAALRRQDPGAGALAAHAYEAAAALGRPDLPALRERDLAALLAGPAAAAGSQAAASSAQRERTYAMVLLGGFAVSEDGRPLDPPPGRPTTLVKLLALAGGPVPFLDEAIEALWPDVDPSTGRQRLRNLLNRLRATSGDLITRAGDNLELAATADVDAQRFEAAAAGALEAAPEERPGQARAALALYAGELLPGDRYEPWAAARRERLRRRYLELLDLLAEDAAERGDLDEAIRLLDQAEAAEPLDEARYVRAAELLLFQGRRGSARSLVERASEVRAGLGLADSPRLARLREATGVAGRPFGRPAATGPTTTG